MPSLSLNGESTLPRKRRNSEPDISTAKRFKLVQDSVLLQNIKSSTLAPIDSWIQTGQWPTGYAAMDPPVNPVHGLKRTSSGTSASRRSSQRPTERINILAQNGVEIEHDANVYKANDNNALWESCQPNNALQEPLLPYPTSELLVALQQASSRNEQRLQRDVLPLIIPSPAWVKLHHTTHEELTTNHLPEHLCEELSGEWIKCKKTFGDTKPRPDFAVGWSASAFTKAEQTALFANQDLDFPSQYTPEMWFPFLVCEIKSRDRPFLEAKRQGINAGALAACALVHLYQAAYLRTDTTKITELSGRILAFSVIMNDDQAELWGVYPGISIVHGAVQVKYRRKVLRRLNYEEEGTQGLTTFYNLIYNIYRVFGPRQLQLIKEALATLPERDANALSFTAAEMLQQPDDPSAGSAADEALKYQISYLMQKMEAAERHRQQNEERWERERQQSEERWQEVIKRYEEKREAERASDRAERQTLLDTIAKLAGNAREK